MSARLDLYKHDASLTKSDEIIDWVLANGREKAAFIVDVDEDMPASLSKAVKKAGYEEGDSVIVIIND